MYKSNQLYESIKKESVVAYPNPYNPKHSSRLLKFSFPANGFSYFEIFNFGMEKVFKSKSINFGSNEIGTLTWNGKNKFGEYVANGVYFFRIKTSNKTYWEKFVIVN